MSPDSRTLSGAAGEALLRRGWSVAVAESCTGGLVAARLTDVPGSSRYVAGGVVAYANSVKIGVLGVSPEVVARHGAVSRETAREMAAGVARVLGVEVGVAITGIAGPEGGTPEKPVGTVWLAIRSPHRAVEEKVHVAGGRAAVREGASTQALSLLLKETSDAVAGGPSAENPEDASG